MKILHIVSNISLRSGIMAFLMNYYRFIDTKLVQFDFLYYEDREFDHKNEIEDLGGRVFKSPIPSSLINFNRFIEDFANAHKGEYDIVHLHDPFLSIFYGKLKKKLRCKSFIAHAHSTKTSDSLIGEIRNRLMLGIGKHIADNLFACSSLAGIKTFGRQFNQNGYVINNAIDLTKYEKAASVREDIRKQWGVEDRFVIGHIGNFTRPKNHHFIVDIFAEISRIRDDAVLMLVGGGPQFETIKSRCEELGLSQKVIFTGVRNDVNSLLSSFDRFLFPSIYEGFGIALVEAQACGLPCIYSDVIPIETNILKDNNRRLSLNDSIEAWVEAVLDPKLVISKDAISEIKNAGFSIRKQAPILTELYDLLSKNEKNECSNKVV